MNSGPPPVHKAAGRSTRPTRATPALGALVGAICGFLTYWSGAAIAAMPYLIRLPHSALPAELMRPFVTWTYWELLLMVAGAVLGTLIARYRWHAAGLLSYVGLLSMIVGFLAYSLTVTIPQVPAEQRWVSYFLFMAEAGGLALIALFAFYTLDAGSRRNWTRRPEMIAWERDYLPVAAFLVPVYNEDCEMVEQTIKHLVDQDYPRDRFLVAVCDDSTDPKVRARLAAYCKKVGAEHVTRKERHGFKAGALNHAIRLLGEEVEYVAVIDADYWVSPNYLRSVVGYFVDPTLSFIQTPQDYRNIDESFLTRQYKRAEAYFYHGIMHSRNEENAIIFCGTMGILRRSAVEEIGGFAEDQICEDAEISVRLAANGWRSLYIDKSYGRGLMPAVFEAYKKQFYRWAFGNVRILLTRAGMIVRSPMSRRQKVDYLTSNLHWFDGFFVMGIALVLLYLGLGPILGYEAVTHHQMELQLLSLVPVALLIDGLIRLYVVLGRAGNISFRETLLVQGMWFSIKLTNTIAVAKCLMGFKTPFIRTPKHPGHRLGVGAALRRAGTLTRVESTLGLMLLGVAAYNVYHVWALGGSPVHYLLAFWLSFYGLIFMCAPVYAYLSYRTLGSDPRVPVPVAARKGRPTGPSNRRAPRGGPRSPFPADRRPVPIQARRPPPVPRGHASRRPVPVPAAPQMRGGGPHAAASPQGWEDHWRDQTRMTKQSSPTWDP